MKKSDVLYQKSKIGYITKLITFTVILCICFLSVGYSAFSNTARIEGALVNVRPVFSARITSLSISNTSNGGISQAEEFNKDKIYGTISLPNENSTVTYKVDVTVFLSTEMKITNISGLPDNLEYSISGYNIDDTLCNLQNECNLGATDDMYITIKYKDNGYNSSNTSYPFNLDFTFETVNVVAKVNNVGYQTLKEAVMSVDANNQETIVHLLMDTTEEITVSSGQNITFNLHGNTINNYDIYSVIENNGIVRILDGKLNCNSGRAAINNNLGSELYISGGTISATGSKQAIYNDGGYLEISGSAVLKNTSNNRAAVQNQANGTMKILGGTITSNRFHGVENHGVMTIGNKDGNPSLSSPEIVGFKYGIMSDQTFNYYDGVIKGVTAAINDEENISDSEDDFTIIRNNETINGSKYKVIVLGSPITITFNANSGTCSESSRTIAKGDSIRELPTASKNGYTFEGWFTSSSGGNKINENTTFNTDSEIFAQYEEIPLVVVAKIGNNEYTSLQDAINAVSSNGTEVTIDLVENVSERLKIKNGQNVRLNIGNHTIRNTGNNPVIENYGILKIYNGTITTNELQGAINNKSSGKLYISGGRIIATGKRQALYNDGGVVEISSSAYLISDTDERATVHNLNNGNITILGGTIIANNYSAVYNAKGTITIGEKDGNISISSPVIQGKLYGIDNESTFNFYDGILKGISGANNGSVNDIETNSTLSNGIEVISSSTYITGYLEQ